MNLKAYRWPQHIFGVKTVIFDLIFWGILGYPVTSDRPKIVKNCQKMSGKNLEHR